LVSTVRWRAPRFRPLRYRSGERDDGRDAHKPMKKKIMADVWPVSAVPSLQMTVNLSSFAASSLTTSGFSKTSISTRPCLP